MVLSEEQIKAVEDLAAANYSPEKIALYLDVNKAEFLKEWYDHHSDIRTAYDRGQLQAEFLINEKQLDLAKSGNITAAQIFLKEAERVKTENIRNRILFGDETND
jgi:hypothetical protein